MKEWKITTKTHLAKFLPLLITLKRTSELFMFQKKYHICEACGKDFSTKAYLKMNIRCVHEGFKNHKCQIYGRAFSQSGELNRQISSVHKRVKNHKWNSWPLYTSSSGKCKLRMYHVYKIIRLPAWFRMSC